MPSVPQVHLVTELASERSQVGTLQLEVANIKKREVDLRQQLESMVDSSQSHREEFSSLRADKAGQSQQACQWPLYSLYRLILFELTLYFAIFS